MWRPDIKKFNTNVHISDRTSGLKNTQTTNHLPHLPELHER